jgi:hypothetical protein
MRSRQAFARAPIVGLQTEEEDTKRRA